MNTISHSILLDRLESLESLDLVPSYFTSHNQFVRLKQFSSKPSFVSAGVLQGSVLGPLLLIIYVLPLGNIFRKFGSTSMLMTPNFTCPPNLPLLSLHPNRLKVWVSFTVLYRSYFISFIRMVIFPHA